MSVTIDVSNLRKSFGGLAAVDDCSLTIEKGTITGLIGPNGAGKTTLFSIISGFLKPDSGTIRLGDQDVTGLAPHKLFRKGLVRSFQIPQVLERMTTLENLMVVPGSQLGENLFNTWLRWGRVRSEDAEIRDKAEDALKFLNLARVRDEQAGNLSGGQKKLVELGRIMMADPKAVLLDEPAAGVNRTLMNDLTRTILKLSDERGYTFCIIEHDMVLVNELCDPVIVMAQGHVLTQGSMKEIRKDERVREAYLGSAA